MTDNGTNPVGQPTADPHHADTALPDDPPTTETTAAKPAPSRQPPPAERAEDLLAGLTGALPVVQPRGVGLDKVTFFTTAAIALAFVVWGIVSPAGLSTASTGALEWVMTSTGWLFVLLSTTFVVFIVWLAASRFGDIPLGGDLEMPEFSTKSWVAMMFSAGMGIGLMFYGTAEPLFHYVSPPPRTGADSQTPEAVQTAMATTLFHWTIHPWAIYAIVGVAIAYSTFRKGRSQLISAVFTPLLGRHTDGPVGKFIDMLAIFATLFGSAASLGLGALQIGAGIEQNGWADSIGATTLVVIIVVLTIAFILSATSGISKGIQLLSNINMYMALALALFVFVVGPTMFILNLLPTSLGWFTAEVAHMASRTDASGLESTRAWLSSWTVFYWAWWISWTPFVGMFIARISRGRTIREFVTGVLIVPSIVSLCWFAVFGGAAIDGQRTFGDLAEKTKDGGLTVNFDGSLFQVLDHYPLASITTVLVMVLVGIFFVSGADAASIVMGTLSEHGTIEPSRTTVIFWGAATGAVAAVMLLAGSANGDLSTALNGLKNITIVSALPFVVVMAGMCFALVRDLRSDPLVRRQVLARRLIDEAVVSGISTAGHSDIKLVVSPSDAAEQEPAPRRSATSRVRGVARRARRRR